MSPRQESHHPPQMVREALEDVASRYSELARDLQAGLVEARGVEEVLDLAERSTLDILAYLPLSPFYCPFCSIHRPNSQDCQGCRYAEEYGACTQTGSVFDQTLEAHYGLVHAVQDIRRRTLEPQEISPKEAEEIKAYLHGQADRLTDLASLFQSQIQEAHSSEEIMYFKKKFMTELVGDLPLESVCRLCKLEHNRLSQAKYEALEGLNKYWQSDPAAA